ncbi:MAG TPA: FAD-linked oxidase C-terminal domain-containing protein, partial [Candidatus Saccharimonadales bacterium]|nr:FAD-linked oxidase C-terminal domain-containing protein [Candidatus Saccharimonadales bacterium]
LGIVTEATLQLVQHNPAAELAVLSLNSLDELHDILPRIIELKPSICEMINKTAIHQITRLSPNQLKGVLDNPAAEIHLILEFDDSKESAQKKAIKRLEKLAEKSGSSLRIADNNEEREKINKLRRAVATLFLETRGNAKAVPVAEDVSLPTARLVDFLHRAIEIYGKAQLQPAVWGQAGDGVVRMRPVLDLGQIGDRQKLFKLADMIYEAALTMGGSITASAGDGRVRAPYMKNVYGQEAHRMMLKVKQIFDPYGILNRGVKTATAEEVKALLRNEYSHQHHEHLSHN